MLGDPCFQIKAARAERMSWPHRSRAVALLALECGVLKEALGGRCSGEAFALESLPRHTDWPCGGHTAVVPAAQRLEVEGLQRSQSACRSAVPPGGGRRQGWETRDRNPGGSW